MSSAWLVLSNDAIAAMAMTTTVSMAPTYGTKLRTLATAPHKAAFGMPRAASTPHVTSPSVTLTTVTVNR